MAVDIIAGLDKIQQSAQAKSGLQVPAGGYQVTVAIIPVSYTHLTLPTKA